MNDLLTDSFVGEASNGQPSRQSDIEMGQVPRSNSDMGMEAFNKQIHEADKQIDKLSVLLQKLKEANEESKAVTKASAMKAIKKRMEKDIDEVGKIAHGVKTKIEAISRDNLSNRQKPGCEKGTGVDRARMNMTNALTKKFKDLMTEFQTLRERIQDEYREVVERRVITVTGTRPDDETIDRLIETGNSEQIFQRAILEAGRGQVVNTVEEIQERHDAVKEIEKKLLDLHQIYLDMAVLAGAQGEILENIESQWRIQKINEGCTVMDDSALPCSASETTSGGFPLLVYFYSLSLFKTKSEFPHHHALFLELVTHRNDGVSVRFSHKYW